jgi:uncharacterized membrane protein YdjX (TVP38/TMEM64 family)
LKSRGDSTREARGTVFQSAICNLQSAIRVFSVPPPRHSLTGRLALVAVLAALVVAFYATGLHEYFDWETVRANIEGLQARVNDNLPLAALAFFAVYVACVALSLPVALVLSLLAGALFGRWVGVGLVSVASTCGASLAFLGARYLFGDWVRRRFADRLAALDRGVERDGAWYLLTLRMAPVVPFFLINLGMGLTPMRAWTFARVTLLGMLPVSWVFANAGTVLASIESPRDVLSPGVLASLLLLALLPLGLRVLLRRPSLDDVAELRTGTDETG